FHIVAPVVSFPSGTPVTVSLMDGITPASIDVTIDPQGFPSPAIVGLSIFTPGATDAVTVLPIRANMLLPTVTVSSIPQLLGDATGVATGTMNFTSTVATPWGMSEVAIPFAILPQGSSASIPSWLSFSPIRGTTPAAVKITATGNPASSETQFGLIGVKTPF